MSTLLQLSVQNFRSFREEAVLSFAPIESGGAPSSLALVYGANGSGKSNLVAAVAWLGAVIKGTRADESLPYEPFRLGVETRSAPSRLEVVFEVQGVRWTYGIAVLPREVVEEWLLRADASGADEVVFERDRAGGLKLGALLSPPGERGAVLRFVAEGTRPNQPFIAEARERHVLELDRTFIWLGSQVVERGPLAGTSRKLEMVALDLLEPAPAKAWVLSALADLELDAADLEVQVTESQRLTFDVIRHDDGGGRVAFDIGEESDGTRRYLELLWIRRSRFHGLTVIDELDASLHTLLAQRFLRAHLAASDGAQLLATTHDTNLLDLNVLSAAMIWFVERGPDGGSRLYSLAEFKPEQLRSMTGHLEAGYLQGRFGAIPFFGDPVRLGWKA
ncbi:MAG: AAA family ATPase [Myxococcota bacterium]